MAWSNPFNFDGNHSVGLANWSQYFNSATFAVPANLELINNAGTSFKKLTHMCDTVHDFMVEVNKFPPKSDANTSLRGLYYAIQELYIAYNSIVPELNKLAVPPVDGIAINPENFLKYLLNLIPGLNADINGPARANLQTIMGVLGPIFQAAKEAETGIADPIAKKQAVAAVFAARLVGGKRKLTKQMGGSNPASGFGHSVEKNLMNMIRQPIGIGDPPDLPDSPAGSGAVGPDRPS
jgi:hypothetical protein